MCKDFCSLLTLGNFFLLNQPEMSSRQDTNTPPPPWCFFVELIFLFSPHILVPKRNMWLYQLIFLFAVSYTQAFVEGMLHSGTMGEYSSIPVKHSCRSSVVTWVLLSSLIKQLFQNLPSRPQQSPLISISIVLESYLKTGIDNCRSACSLHLRYCQIHSELLRNDWL